VETWPGTTLRLFVRCAGVYLMVTGLYSWAAEMKEGEVRVTDCLHSHAPFYRHSTRGVVLEKKWGGRLKQDLWAYYNCDTSTIRVRFEYDSSTIRLQHATTRYEVFLCARIRDRFEHSTRISGRRVLHVD